MVEPDLVVLGPLRPPALLLSHLHLRDGDGLTALDHALAASRETLRSPTPPSLRVRSAVRRSIESRGKLSTSDLLLLRYSPSRGSMYNEVPHSPLSPRRSSSSPLPLPMLRLLMLLSVRSRSLSSVVIVAQPTPF